MSGRARRALEDEDARLASDAPGEWFTSYRRQFLARLVVLAEDVERMEKSAAAEDEAR